MRTAGTLLLGVIVLGCVALLPDFTAHVISSFTPTRCPIVPADLLAIGSALEQYRTEHGGLCPDTLTELVTASPGRDPYLHGCTRAFEDPWGRPYRYQPDASRRSFRLCSYGSDGVPGGRGDAEDFSVSSATGAGASQR